MRLIEQIGKWLDRRLQLGEPIREIAEHSVPRRSASWWYVFGSAALTVFALQIVTGIMLALIYVPSASEAWNSLQFLNHGVALGWFIRALHGWGSNFMVAIVLIHMAQVFLFGAYKFPRELTWLIGVFLLLMTLGMAFSGQVLRFDQDAYWGLGIGASIASRTPIVGAALVKLILGGPIIGGATLSRFFALHVFVIPGMLIAFVSLHLFLVLKVGINEWPMPGRIVRRGNLCQAVRGVAQERRRALRSLRYLEGSDFLRHHSVGSCPLCVFLRSLRPNRCARPYHHPNSTEARLLFLVDLCSACALAAIARNSCPPHRAGRGDRCARASSLCSRRRRETLAQTAHCSSLRYPHCAHARNVHASGGIQPVEPQNGRVER